MNKLNVGSIECLIVELLDQLNYEKIQKYMIADDWIWDSSVIQSTESRTPTIPEIRALASSLIRQAAYNLADQRLLKTSIYSGGFLAIAELNPSRNRVFLQLNFVIDHKTVDEEIIIQ